MIARMRRLVFVSLPFVLIAAPLRQVSLGQEPAVTPAAAAETAAESDEIDFNMARRLLRPQRRGEKLTPEEREYLQRARNTRRRQVPRRSNSAGKSSLGLIPLTDMTADDRYKGQDGGLYGGGRNTPPEDHLQAALHAAKMIVPLDADGKSSADGKIVMISNGMSNTTQEFSQFVRLADVDADKSPRVKIVDCAQGGQESLDWAQPDKRFRKDRANPWDVMMQRLKRAEASPQQVQVAWILQARRNPKSRGEFPKHTDEFQGHLVVIVNKLKERFPNLRLVYLSSRIYAGYATTQLNPEPYAYEYAFAIRSLIQDQIKGVALLNYDPKRGNVKAPRLLWGPYLWADGVKGRKMDDLVWRREDLAGDGTHPSPSGRKMVAEQLLKFMKTDPTAKAWFLKDSSISQRAARGSRDAAHTWAGTWQAAGSDQCKELRCQARRVAGADWEARFTGVCNRRFSFEVIMNGRATGGKIVFDGKTNLGEENGGVYVWTGQIVGRTFTGKYESTGGKTGTFTMTPARLTVSGSALEAAKDRRVKTDR